VVELRVHGLRKRKLDEREQKSDVHPHDAADVTEPVVSIL
jgi:hypothetical protein